MNFTAATVIKMPMAPHLPIPSLVMLVVAKIQCTNGWQSARPKVQKFPPSWAVFKVAQCKNC